MNAIKFELNNEYSNFLSKIFNHFDEENYVWKIADSEVLINADQFLFEKEYYDETDFKKIINEQKYYLIFLSIELYKNNPSSEQIRNYDDFLKSDCELFLRIIDSTLVYICTKNKEILDIIYNNAIENNFSNVSLIENVDDANRLIF